MLYECTFVHACSCTMYMTCTHKIYRCNVPEIQKNVHLSTIWQFTSQNFKTLIVCHLTFFIVFWKCQISQIFPVFFSSGSLIYVQARQPIFLFSWVSLYIYIYTWHCILYIVYTVIWSCSHTFKDCPYSIYTPGYTCVLTPQLLLVHLALAIHENL